MKRLMMILVAMGFGFSLASPVSQAASKCTGANCGTKAKQEATPGSLPKGAPNKVIKKKVRTAPAIQGKGHDGYTAEERAKILESARQVCKKNYGAPSTVYRVDYKKLRVTCVRPGY